MADRLATVEIEIARRVGETDTLFGSVTNADIAEALAAKGFDLDRRKPSSTSRSRSSGVRRAGEAHRDVVVTPR
jgi:large subunit ribosomal protein L9